MYSFIGLQCFSGQFPISVTLHHTVAVAGHFGGTSAAMFRAKDQSVWAYGPNWLSARTEMSWCRNVLEPKCPTHVVSADTVNCFKNRLDKFWSNQEVLYNHKADLHGTKNRIILE